MEAIRQWPAEELIPHPLNPRGPVDAGADDIAELAASIAAQGVLVPLLVTPGGMVIAGHRRLAAARIAGLTTVPVIVRDLSPTEQLAAMLVENLQREGVGPVRLGTAFQRLFQAGNSSREIGRMIGKSAGYVDYYRALTRLPADLQARVEAGALSVAVGNALVRFVDRPEALARVVTGIERNGWGGDQIRGLTDDGEWPRPAMQPEVTRTRIAGPDQRGYVNTLAERTVAVDLAGNTSIGDARLAERSDIAEYLRHRAGDVRWTREAREALFRLAVEIDEGRHAGMGGQRTA